VRGYKPRPRAPHPAPSSVCLRKTPLDEQDGEDYSPPRVRSIVLYEYFLRRSWRGAPLFWSGNHIIGRAIGGHAPPGERNTLAQSQLDELSLRQGADFDKLYASDAVSVHKTAVSLFQRNSKGGDNPDLKAFAAKYLPVVQMHQQMAQELNKAPAPTVGQTAKRLKQFMRKSMKRPSSGVG
jgi:Domain of unknown function (DUF4142)